MAVLHTVAVQHAFSDAVLSTVHSLPVALSVSLEKCQKNSLFLLIKTKESLSDLKKPLCVSKNRV